ncbi:hypothetical protein FOB72_11215 [Cupriavidus pauculus]|uniref:Uncharacterized protein n=1 Tax=Cupriavidus pauculus TaxID=82633 RepID=A0A5P2H5C1_9BURK|nr:hypothetical protein [Cupriavidus pauculus]QET02549.1 hypothetical protein FOB72_11215 [Cupriavidus pauculus]
MDNHRAAWWCWLRHLPSEERADLFHIDRHFDTLSSNLALWLQHLPAQMRGVSLVDYLNFRGTINGFPCEIIRWDNYLSLFLEHEKNHLGQLYFATHGDGDEPNVPEGSYRNVLPWDIPKNFDFWLTEGRNWIVNIDLDYFFCDMEDGECRRLLGPEYVEDLCLTIKKHLATGLIKVLTICLTPDEHGYSGGWASAESLCAEFCHHLGLDFKLP